MLVYKFGGASIATPERMTALLPIIQEAKEPLVIVLSAFGKTTNALEAIVDKACKGDKEGALALAQQIEEDHLSFAKALLNDVYLKQASEALHIFFTEIQWAIDDADASRYDYFYDQIVCVGELMSTTIFAQLVKQSGQNYEWVDARDLIRTDDTYRDPKVDWDFSQQQTVALVGAKLNNGTNIITQGFIGATSDNASVTLGREGSDYTAALLAAWLKAKSVTIWKDVEGLRNADPKEFSNTVTIEAITFHEVIEMAYYGAQVIHPKTIKPLQNNNIPLYVKCFLNKDFKGTVIQNEVNTIFYPSLIIQKKNQILLQVTTKDFSFITEDNLSYLYKVFHGLKIKINLIQNAAISFVACIDNNEQKLVQLLSELEKNYKVLRNDNVTLLTVRHYTSEILTELLKGRYQLLEQKTRNTVQAVLK